MFKPIKDFFNEYVLRKNYEDVFLLCDNPCCKSQIISDDIFAYDKSTKQIYHFGECQLVSKPFINKNGRLVYQNHVSITRKEAAKLYRKGKLLQSKTMKLEEKLLVGK